MLNVPLSLKVYGWPPFTTRPLATTLREQPASAKQNTNNSPERQQRRCPMRACPGRTARAVPAPEELGTRHGTSSPSGRQTGERARRLGGTGGRSVGSVRLAVVAAVHVVPHL